MADNQQPGLLANILAVAGFIILILIIVWGAYNLLKLTGVGFSNIFSRFSSGEITVTAPEEAVESKEAFPLSWEYAPKEDGTYALLYQCEEKLSIDMQADGGPVAAIPCGSAYGVGTLKSVSLTPKFTGSESVEVPLTIVFLPAATTSDARAEGSATVTIAPTASESATPTAVTPEPTPIAQPKPSVAGTPDLSVRIIAVGVIDPVSGAFIQRAPVNSNETAAVQFDIQNVGSAASGAYRFNVQLPTQPVYPYISAPQASLAPGSHVLSTLRFGPIAPGGGTISVEVDSTRSVKDVTRTNNTAAVHMNAPTYPYYYQAPFVY